MNEEHGGVSEAYRRRVLQTLSLAGGVGLWSSSSVAKQGQGSSGGRKQDDEEAVLGDFETGLDGWKTTGRTQLSRVTADEFPAAVTSGTHALAAEINGDSFPMIENRRQVRDAPFSSHPFLRTHVVALVEGSDSDILVQFRLHHSKGQGNGSNGSNSSRSKDENVVESTFKRAPQLAPTELQWDMSEVSEEVRRNAKYLEIVWYPAEHEPDGGHRGQNQGGFDYEGLTIFDSIRLFESKQLTSESRKQQKKTALHRKHGMIVDRTLDEQAEGFERGTLTFSDGYTSTYTFEVIAPDTFEYTIDGETFELGGGQE
ncbi:hypothetical protein AB2S56_014580 [Haloparvum sp. AD34]